MGRRHARHRIRSASGGAALNAERNSPDLETLEILERARLLADGGRLDEAVDLLEGRVEVGPPCLETLCMLAELLEEGEAWSRALAVVDHSRRDARDPAELRRLDFLGKRIREEATVRLHERVHASRTEEVASEEIMSLATAALGEAVVLAEPAADGVGRWLLRTLRSAHRLEIIDGSLQLADMRRGTVRRLELDVVTSPATEEAVTDGLPRQSLDHSIMEALANLEDGELFREARPGPSSDEPDPSSVAAQAPRPAAAQSVPSGSQQDLPSVAARARPAVKKGSVSWKALVPVPTSTDFEATDVDPEETWKAFDEACELMDGGDLEEALRLLRGIERVAEKDEALSKEVRGLLDRLAPSEGAHSEPDEKPVATVPVPSVQAVPSAGASPQDGAGEGTAEAVPDRSRARLALERARSTVTLMTMREGGEFEALGGQARESFQEALRLDPDLEGIITYELACLHHQKLRRLDEAVRLYCRFLELAAPGDPLAAVARERLEKLENLI